MKTPLPLLSAALLLLTACGAPPADTSADTPPAASSSALSSAARVALLLRGPGAETVRLQVEIADTPALQEKGLMGRTALGTDEGMLFVFPGEQPLNFWMKDTLIPLDILFFDARGSLVSTESMVPCQEGTVCTVYASGKPARYALELPAGSIGSRGIAPGTWSMDVPTP